MIRSKVAVALMALAVAACGGGESEEEIADRLDSKGTMELMEEAGQDEYTAPENNLLTESQVEMYLKVRDREAKIAEVARKEMQDRSKVAEEKKEGVGGFMAAVKSLESAADLMTADIRAAQELGYNTAEYQWVKERIIEASGDALREQWDTQMSTQLNEQEEQTKQALANASTPEEKQMYEQILQGIKEMREASADEEQDPWIAENRKLLEKHENALKAIEMEVAKFTDNPEEVNLGVQPQVQ